MSNSVSSFVKDSVIPKGMATAAAARALGIGRQALHSFLTGKARLSAEMANNLERVFGADAASLLKMQSDIDAKETAIAAAKEKASGYLKITASDIEAWTEKNQISARSLLPVLVRRLIHTTTQEITELDFHGYEEAERQGWDGEVTSGAGSAKVPQGKSGWELTCSNALPAKPTDDINAREKLVDKAQRTSTTFVFVTARRWKEKDVWADRRRASGAWKDVRAYDAEDLAQWLEQSPATQIWFHEQIGRPADGVKSLDLAWKEWSLACDPNLPGKLFEGVVNQKRKALDSWLADTGSKPLIITADSVAEALAFLFQALPPHLADDAIIVSTADALRRTSAATCTSILVIDRPELEPLAGPSFHTHKIIVVRPKTSIENDADIEIGQIEFESFRLALGEMGFDHAEVSSYSAKSAQSATILRRLFAKAPALRKPTWAESGTSLARRLIPILLAGAWSKSNKIDCDIVGQLAGKPYHEVEQDIAELLSIPDSPVWAIGNFRGVICRRDALFASHHGVLEHDLTEFLEWAKLVLSEDDPALDLDPNERWSAGIYGKKREISGALRNAIGEMLVLLAVYGEQLLQDRIPNVVDQVELVVRDLMSGKSTRELLSLSADFQHLAEAAPSTFLNCIEADLNSDNPQILPLMRSVKPGSMGGTDRTTILWALELLAWDEAHYLRVVRILAKLSQIPITDNHTNRPENSLESLVSCWHPETTVNVAGRIGALQRLANEFPEVGWRICLAQVSSHTRTAMPNSRPTYRSIGLAGRRNVTYEEMWQVVDAAWEILLNQNIYTAEKLVDLIQELHGMSEAHKLRLVETIKAWAATASDSDRELAARALRQAGYSPDQPAASDASKVDIDLFEVARLVQPVDLVDRHQWLFAEHYIPESRSELKDGKFDYDARNKWVANRRNAAVAEIYSAHGIVGIIKLIENGNASFPVGLSLANGLSEDAIPEVIEHFMRHRDDSNAVRIQNAITGLLLKNGNDGVCEIAHATIRRFATDMANWQEICLPVLLACPFFPAVWDMIEAQYPTVEEAYWRNVVPNALRMEADQYDRMIDRLLHVKRPRAAFAAVHYCVNEVSASTLARLMGALVASSDEAPGEYRIDGYAINQCLAHLDRKKALPTDEMAGLEFVFIDALTHGEHGIPNLDRRNAENPGAFVELVALLYKRKDGGEDPEQYRLSPDADAQSVAHNVYRVIDKLSLTPGTSEDGVIDVEKLVAWIKSAQKILRDLSREDIGDQCIGTLLGRCPASADGIWPHEAVRMALEEVGNENILRGMALAIYNSRGVVWRGPGGDQERVLAAKYEGWAKAVARDHPFSARLLNEIRDHYLRDAKWHDTDESVNRRLGKN